MKINLRTAVSRLFPTHSFEMIYVEAVANAIDAEATKIDININYTKKFGFSEFMITDNGKGFGEEGCTRFSNLMESKDNSHKGQGRLVYLHYFHQVIFNSVYTENNELKSIKFDFDYDFDESKIQHIDPTSGHTGTKVSFKKYSKTKLGKAEYVNADYIKKLILEQFMPCLQKLKDEKKPLEINIASNADDDHSQSTVSVSNIPNFKVIEIEKELLENLSNKLSNEIGKDLFRESIKLYYYINKTTIKQGTFTTSFAIDNRSMSVDIIDRTNYIDYVEAIFFLTSKGFDGLVDGARQELRISDSDGKAIKQIFKEKLNSILDKEVPSFTKNKQRQNKFLLSKYPHLHGYLPMDKIGFDSKQEILHVARDKFFSQQSNLIEKEHLTERDYKVALEISSRNLAEYVIFRQMQIDKLKNVKDDDREKVIHDLISPQYSIDEQKNINIYKNNAWVLDDRFMSFTYSFSDTQFTRISQLNTFNYQSESTEKPDFLMLFSKPLENQPKEVDIVIFEFKRLNCDKYDKSKAVTQLVEYAGEIRDICGTDSTTTKLGKIWLYALVVIDDKFRKTLDRNDYIQKFSVAGEYWSTYKINVDAEIVILDYDSLISDANARNKTFIDILKNSFNDD